MSASSDDRGTKPVAYGPTALATVTVALVAWRIAFNLGAYGQVFYDDVFSFVVVSTVGLVIAAVASPHDQRTKRLTLIALAAPAAWLTLAVVFFDSVSDAASGPVFGVLAFVVVVIAVPVGVKLLLDLFAPGLVSFENPRVLGYAVLIIASVALAGLVVGSNNDAFLTCDDFKVAGSDTPSNCAP